MENIILCIVYPLPTRIGKFMKENKKMMIFMIKYCCYMSSAFPKDKCGFNVGEHDILFFPCVNDAVVLCKTFFGMLCGWWCYEEVGNHDMT